MQPMRVQRLRIAFFWTVSRKVDKIGSEEGEGNALSCGIALSRDLPNNNARASLEFVDKAQA